VPSNKATRHFAIIRGAKKWTNTFGYYKKSFLDKEMVCMALCTGISDPIRSKKTDKNTFTFGEKMARLGVFLVQSGRFLVVQKLIELNVGSNI